MAYPKLEKPPINEVVTGFVFEANDRLTTVVHGLYWERRKADFATYELHPAITDVPTIWEGVAPQRTWLITADETRLVQIQNDRLFVNWRKRRPTDEYPRFMTRDGTPGLLAYALTEFQRFADFARERELAIALTHVELTKIDVFARGEHWTDENDLGALLPMVRGLSAITPSGAGADLALKLAQQRADGGVFVMSAASGVHRQSKEPVIRVETRVRAKVADPSQLEALFVGLNDDVNGTFFRMIPEAELTRFKGTSR